MTAVVLASLLSQLPPVPGSAQPTSVAQPVVQAQQAPVVQPLVQVPKAAPAQEDEAQDDSTDSTSTSQQLPQTPQLAQLPQVSQLPQNAIPQPNVSQTVTIYIDGQRLGMRPRMQQPAQPVQEQFTQPQPSAYYAPPQFAPPVVQAGFYPVVRQRVFIRPHFFARRYFARRYY